MAIPKKNATVNGESTFMTLVISVIPLLYHNDSLRSQTKKARGAETPRVKTRTDYYFLPFFIFRGSFCLGGFLSAADSGAGISSAALWASAFTTGALAPSPSSLVAGTGPSGTSSPEREVMGSDATSALDAARIS